MANIFDGNDIAVDAYPLRWSWRCTKLTFPFTPRLGVACLSAFSRLVVHQMVLWCSWGKFLCFCSISDLLPNWRAFYRSWHSTVVQYVCGDRPYLGYGVACQVRLMAEPCLVCAFSLSGILGLHPCSSLPQGKELGFIHVGNSGNEWFVFG